MAVVLVEISLSSGTLALAVDIVGGSVCDDGFNVVVGLNVVVDCGVVVLVVMVLLVLMVVVVSRDLQSWSSYQLGLRS
jgi:hypothetical protein